MRKGIGDILAGKYLFLSTREDNNTVLIKIFSAPMMILYMKRNVQAFSNSGWMFPMDNTK